VGRSGLFCLRDIGRAGQGSPGVAVDLMRRWRRVRHKGAGRKWLVNRLLQETPRAIVCLKQDLHPFAHFHVAGAGGFQERSSLLRRFFQRKVE
jgi:hypothetical protein